MRRVQGRDGAGKKILGRGRFKKNSGNFLGKRVTGRVIKALFSFIGLG